MTHYILVDKIPTPEPDIYKWSKWFENTNRKVKETFLAEGKVRISTVFIGMPSIYPILFETMIFGEHEREGECYRDDTWDEAVRTHDRLHKELKNA